MRYITLVFHGRTGLSGGSMGKRMWVLNFVPAVDKVLGVGHDD